MKALLALGFAFVIASDAASASADGAGAERFVALTATFQTVRASSRGSERRSWRLVRSNGRVDYEWMDEGWIDTWRADAGGELSLVQRSEPERTLIEYTPGQLRALQTQRSWRELNSLLAANPHDLGLRRTGSSRVLGTAAEQYTGRRGAQTISLTWLPREQLAYSLVLKEGGRTTRVRLQKLTLGAAAVRGAAALSGYRRLDAADLGDMEGDAFVRRHEQRLHAHAHP